MEGKKRKAVLAVTALLLVGMVLLLWQTGFFEATATPQEMEAYISRFSPYSQIIFFLLQVATVILAPIPSNLTAAAGGLLFGTLPSFLLTYGAVLCGSAIVFLLARAVGQKQVEGFVSRKVSERYLELIRSKRDTFLTLALLLPFFPDDLLCILAGVTDIPLRRYLVIVALARPWGLLVASAVGGSVLNIPLPGMVAIGLAGAALFFLGMKYGDRVERAVIAHFQKKEKK